MIWIGWILGVLVALLLLASAVMKVMKVPSVVEGFAHFGYPERVILGLGVVELTCAVLYLIPRTAVLGAVLVTGYLGGATATTLRVGEPYFLPALLGVVAWLGIYLRDARVRALLPLRRPAL
jgi:hypothetical protein